MRGGQSTTEYLLILAAFASMVGALGLLWRAASGGTLLSLATVAASHAAPEGFDVRPFALRRLAAVPEVSVFHVGGQQDWEVSTEGPDERGLVKVLLSGHARPLPLLGGICGLLGESDEKGLVLEARVTASTRPDWLEGSYGDWVGMWR